MSAAVIVTVTTEVSKARYYPWGKDRFTSGTTPTSFKFTGQRYEDHLGFRLYYYGARWYDPQLGRFIQPDTLVPNPGDAQAFDRYAYTLNNPLKYVDPSGHRPCLATAGKCVQSVQLNYQAADQLANHLSDLNVDWADIPVNVRSAFQAEGMHEGIYTDLQGNAQVQTGLLDPATFAASAFGIGRLVWRLPALLFSCADGDCTNEVEAVRQVSQSDRVSNAYTIAKEGGKHAGFLRNYAGRSVDQIQKGIYSIEQLILEHRDKIASPEKYISNFRELDPRQQEALLTRKWPADIQRQTEQLEILKGLLNELINQ